LSRGLQRTRLRPELFLHWLQDTDRLYFRFELLAKQIQSFATTSILARCATVRAIAERLADVLSRCDFITYDDPGQAEAYALLHFLDRYHRFQLILARLVELRLLPVKSLPIDILDVGTGPGPSLFAVSDIYSWLAEYGVAIGNQPLAEVSVKMNYVENSFRFRDWLGQFTEYANFANQRPTQPWRVPLHFDFGPFHDFVGLNFQQEKNALFEMRVRRIEREFENDDEDPHQRFDHNRPE
jgi:hypothetical protein